MSRLRLLGLVVVAALTGCQTLTSSPAPTPTPGQAITPTAEATAEAGSTLLHNADGALDWLKGIARFEGASSCTGTFIQTSDQASAPAYLITNGHCAQPWQANAVYRDMPAPEDIRATFNYFIDTPAADQVAVSARTIAYSTMKGRDMAIVELAATAGELTGRGVRPLAIADAAPAPAAAISVFGVPVTGLPPEEWFLRREDCALTGQADLLEFQWHFFDAFGNTCRDIFGGSSGSPAFAEGGDAVFALINTTTVGAEYACALGAPCEVTSGGVQLRPDTSYATPIMGLSGCFDASGRFDADAPDCPLDGGRQMELSGHPLSAIQPFVTDGSGARTRAAWKTTLSGGFTHYRYKTGAVSGVNCRDEIGYSGPIALAVDNLIEDEVPEAEGFYYLCLVAGNSAVGDAAWQAVGDATVVFAHVDATPPLIPPALSVLDLEDAYLVEPIFKLPELVDYVLKFGPPATTDCADPAGYMPYRRFAVWIDKQEQTPARLCVIGYDEANNPSPPLEQILDGEAP